jgi:ubiquinone/menaquinone biosynthesis C-methylase UbiE
MTPAMDDSIDAKNFWEGVYAANLASEVSWYQRHPRQSLALIHDAVGQSSSVLDVGGGDSTLVDHLIDEGYTALSLLDVSSTALRRAQERLGVKAALVRWYEADVLTSVLPDASVDLWHDRAVFHFLVDRRDRTRYLAEVRRVVRPGGHVIVATFAEDGPLRCSGLPVARYSAEALHAEFGNDFRLMRSIREAHLTPAGSEQLFTYCWFQYEGAGRPRSS